MDVKQESVPLLTTDTSAAHPISNASPISPTPAVHDTHATSDIQTPAPNAHEPTDANIANASQNTSNISTTIAATTNISSGIPSDDRIFDGRVLTKHSRLVVLTLRTNRISWHEKEECSVLLSAIIGVTTMGRFFTIHYILQEKKQKVKETLTFKCENDLLPKTWAENIHKALNQDGKGPQGCRVIFVVNPFSGTKKAVGVLSSVRHLFDIARMHVTVIETNAAGHAREIGRTFDLKAVDKLVCVSGDGLFNELINGIMDRPDWRDAVKIPLGIIPAGSGNGLSSALGSFSPTEAAFAIIKGNARPFDILRTTQNGVSLYGFLTLTWAMISDVDIESEKMRWMGALRFSIGAFKRIMSLRRYKGKITYLPAGGDPLQPHASCGSFQKCSHCNKVPESVEPDLTSCLYDPTQPPPPGWKVMEDEFVVFIVTNVSHISTDFIASPHAHLSDGALDLVIIRATAEITKPKLISILLQTETGKYIHSPLVEHFKIKALYLEPGRVVDKEKDAADIGVMAVDGERVPYAPIGVEVFRGLFSILCE